MISKPDDVLARLRAALPESHADVNRIAAEVAAEGLTEPDSLLKFVLEDYTWAVLGRRPRAPEPDLARWRRWVTFLDGEYGHDPDLDETITYWVLSNLPASRDEEDPHGLRDALGPRLAQALDAHLALRERIKPEPDPTTDAFLNQLAERFPELRHDLEENRDGDRLLGILFLCDVARQVTALYATGGVAVGRAQQIIDAIEAGYGESESLDTAIDTGFVEGLPMSYEPHADLSEMLGPRLLHSWQLWQGPHGSQSG